MTNIAYLWEPDPKVLGNAVFKVAEELEDMTVPLAFAGEQVRGDVRNRFMTETDPSGNPWASWADSYKPVAEARPNPGILRRPGQVLYKAATDPSAVIISNNVVWYNTGNLPEYGEWHQDGRPDRKTKSGSPNPLPKREFLGLSVEAGLVIFEAFGDWYDRALQFYPTSAGRVGRRHSLRGPGGQFAPRAAPMRSRIG